MNQSRISQQRRRQILEAFAQCIEEKGSYDAVSIRDIAIKSGITLSSIYYYFVNKKDIAVAFFNQAQVHCFDLLDEKYAEPLVSCQSIKEFLRIYVAWIRDSFTTNPSLFRSSRLFMQCRLNPQVAEVIQNHDAIHNEAIIKLLKQAQIQDPHPELTCRFLSMLMEGISLYTITQNETTASMEYIEHFINLLPD